MLDSISFVQVIVIYYWLICMIFQSFHGNSNEKLILWLQDKSSISPAIVKRLVVPNNIVSIFPFLRLWQAYFYECRITGSAYLDSHHFQFSLCFHGKHATLYHQRT